MAGKIQKCRNAVVGKNQNVMESKYAIKRANMDNYRFNLPARTHLLKSDERDFSPAFSSMKRCPVPEMKTRMMLLVSLATPFWSLLRSVASRASEAAVLQASQPVSLQTSEVAALWTSEAVA